MNKFAKATGDYPSLSAVDIRLMALTYQLTEEKLGSQASKLLNKDPEKIRLQRETILSGSRSSATKMENAFDIPSEKIIFQDETLDEPLEKELSKLSVDNDSAPKSRLNV